VRPHSGESGFTLVELLVSMTLFLIVMGAALTSFDAFSNNERRSQNLTDSQVQARNTLDRMARELRNLASPDDNHPQSIEWAQPFDLVFRTINPVGPGTSSNPTNLMRVRYCLDDSNSQNATLYRLVEVPNPGSALRSFDESQATPTSPANDPLVSGGCPVTSLPVSTNATLVSTRVLGQNVSNERVSNRPLFDYLPSATPTTNISHIVVKLFVDINSATKVPAEVELSTSAFLRNQNRKPVADIESPPVVTANNHILLNGSGSVDPEGTALTYSWTVTPIGGGAVGTSTSVLYDYAGTSNKTYSLSLTVKDSAGLSSTPATVGCVATPPATC
jgi:prepilin-type N-terminal cleavage/methylation domain-containing protein